MKYEDSAHMDAEIAGGAVSMMKAHPWLSEANKAPNAHELARAVVIDLERRAVKLRAFCTSDMTRNLAEELDEAAQRLRRKIRSIEASSGAIYDYLREIALAMSNLAMGDFKLRAALDTPPTIPDPPKLEERAPPRRTGGRKATKAPPLGHGEPWQKYLIVRGPGRPRRTDVALTDEQNIAQAKQKLMLERVRASASGSKGQIVRRVARKPEERL